MCKYQFIWCKLCWDIPCPSSPSPYLNALWTQTCCWFTAPIELSNLASLCIPSAQLINFNCSALSSARCRYITDMSGHELAQPPIRSRATSLWLKKSFGLSKRLFYLSICSFTFLHLTNAFIQRDFALKACSFDNKMMVLIAPCTTATGTCAVKFCELRKFNSIWRFKGVEK